MSISMHFIRSAASFSCAFVCCCSAYWIFRQVQRGKGSNNSTEYAADDSISNEILTFWFEGDLQEKHKNVWFATGVERERIDLEIKRLFGKILSKAESGELTEVWTRTPQICLAFVILLDQFSRHVYRAATNRDERLKICDDLAFSATRKALEKGWQWKLTAAQHVFLLMPLRHRKPSTKQHLVEVLDQISLREKFENENQKLVLARFRRVTTRKLLEISGMSVPGDEILERHPFPADLSGMHKSKLVVGVQSFLKAQGFSSSMTAAVSLSGGVDSMVIAMILCHLSKKMKFRVLAIHIDYANRQESGREAAFVEKWCSDHNVFFRKRVIDEVKRGVTERNEYEAVAREARFQAYKVAMKEFDPCPAVIVGHHRGDLQENVISNIFKGCSVLTVAGMESESISSGMLIWRPLLSFDKEEIFDFAHTYGVPYFKDTTPLWSTRGKLRGTLIPALKDMYGDGVLNHLSGMAHESDEICKDLDYFLFEPFRSSVKQYSMGVSINLLPFRGRGLYFWRKAFMDVLHSMGLPMLSDAALHMVLTRLGNSPDLPNPKASWWALKKDFRSFCSEDGVLFIFHPKSAPPVPYAVGFEGTEVCVGGEPIRVGVWEIEVSEMDSVSLPPNASSVVDIKRPPFRNISEFMTGEFSYKVATTSRRCMKLVVLPPPILSNKNSQTADDVQERQKKPQVPICFKEVDLGLRSCLPIVSTSNDDYLDLRMLQRAAEPFRVVDVRYRYVG